MRSTRASVTGGYDNGAVDDAGIFIAGVMSSGLLVFGVGSSGLFVSGYMISGVFNNFLSPLTALSTTPFTVLNARRNCPEAGELA